MTIESHGHEHELEPQYGLPERLPAGERILWQGSPDARALARRAFHLHKLAVYFAVLLVLQAGAALASGDSIAAALAGLAWPAALALTALASIALLAWLTARTAVYTLTDRRVVMRIGIVLTLTFNLPLRAIESAALRGDRDGHGDIVLKLAGSDTIAWVHLWPHVRPWRLTRPEPMLRSISDAGRVAALLSETWSQATGIAATPAAAAEPAAGRPEPVWQPSPT
jgi:hypothetical protein